MWIHLLTIIKNNLRANLILMAGMFVIATSLWYAVDYVYTVSVNARKSLGFDWHHVYYVQAEVLPDESAERDTATRSDDEVTAEYMEFYDRLQHHPAIESVCCTYMHFHYIWKNMTTQLSLDSLTISALYREVTPSYFTVFRVKGADGCSPEELTRRAANVNELVLTKNAAATLVCPPSLLGPDGTPPPSIRPTEIAGRMIATSTLREGETDSARVVAVCEDQKYNEYGPWSRAAYRIIRFGQGNFRLGYGSIPYHDLFVRVKPEADRPGFVEAFRKEMKRQLRVGNLYLADMRPMSHYRDDQLASYRSDLYTYLAIAGFFLLNAFLAILGTFWFRTQQRREELAVRLVAGATPRSLMKLLMGEGLMLITLSYVPAMVVAYNLGVSDLVATYPVDWSLTRFIVGGLVTYLLLILITTISIGFPARQAMRIQPATALHGE